MPLSISRREPRRAPATEAAAAYAHTTNAASRRNEPNEAMWRVEDRTRAGRREDYVPGVLPGTCAGISVFASYFDGHLAMTPLGATSKPCGDNVPLTTTSDPSLNVSGTTPV